MLDVWFENVKIAPKIRSKIEKEKQAFCDLLQELQDNYLRLYIRVEEGYGYPCRLVSEINTKYIKVDTTDINWILQKIQRFEEVTINSNYFTLSLGKSFEKSELMTQDFLSTAIQTIVDLYPIYQFYKDVL